MRNVLLLPLVCALTVFPTFDVLARQLTPAEALRNAQAENAGAGKRVRALGAGSAMSLAYTAHNEGVCYYYVFNNNSTDGGFVILSADDLAPAVLGYVDGGGFDYDKAPENMKWWLSQYEQGIGEAIKTGKAIRRIEAEGRDAVWPMIDATWDQAEPYNNMCPPINGQPTCTGCVATALSQIMYYHRWPETGTGTHSYSIESKGLELSVDFGSTTYKWDDMLPVYEKGKYTDEQAEAVATLMYHCGVGVNMDFDTSASGASDMNVPNALISYFGYDKAMTLEHRIFYTDEEWETLVYNELAAQRPVYYSASTDKREGHAFVCDGYDGDGMFHFNWGWSGYYNGYFLITGAGALNPGGSGIGGGTAGYAFVNDQVCLVGMQKAQEGSEMRITMGCYSEYTIDANGSEVTRDSWLAFYGGVYNLSAMAVDVEIGLMFKSTTTENIYYTSIGSATFDVYQGIDGFWFTPSSVVMNGEYEVYPVYRSTNDSMQWERVKIPAGMEIPKITVTGDMPPVMLSEPIYVNDGNNVITADNVTLHFSLTATEDVKDQVFAGRVIDEYGYGIECLRTDPVSLTAGETRSFVLSRYMSDVLTIGETYFIQVQNYFTDEWLTPYEYNYVVFTVADPAGISSVTSADRDVNVYSSTGVLLRKGVQAKEALEGLPRGMYIVDGKKIIKR